MSASKITRRRLLAATAAPLAASSQTKLTLSPRGTSILLPVNPADDERRAAELLQEFLRKSTGSSSGFAIRPESDAVSGAQVCIGRTRWAPTDELSKIYRDGFLIRRAGNRVIICGGAPPGTFYGASRFLDQFCGVRFYMPGDLFTYVPRRANIEVGSVNIVDQPFVKNCMMSGVGAMSGTGGYLPGAPRPAERDWLKRNAAFRKESVQFSHQHSMFQRFPPDKFAERYPEIYPIIGGKRYIPADNKDQKWQPCLTEPKLADAAVESAADYFAKNPDLRFISFSIQDSHVFCECERCKREYAKNKDKVAVLSDLNAAFLNRVSDGLEKSVPGKTIVYIAYSQVRYVPTFPLRSNIMPVAVFTIGDMLIDKWLEPGNNIVDKWAAAVRRMGNHDWGQGNGYFIPRYYVGLTSRFFRYVKAKELIWDYQHFEAYPNWGLDGPKLYATAQIWWNPDTDPDAVFRQMSSDLFPAAHSEMYGYFQTMEKLWIALDDTAERKLKKWSNQFEMNVDQRKLIEEGRRRLDRALSLARTGDEKKRVELFSKTYRLSEQLFSIANSKAVDPAEVDALRAHVRREIAPDPMTVFLAPDDAALVKEIDTALTVITKR